MSAPLRQSGALIGLPEALLLADDPKMDALLKDPSILSRPRPSGSLVAFARTPHALRVLLARGVSPFDKDRWGSDAMDALSRLGPKGAPLVQALAEQGHTPSPADIARPGDLARLQAMIARGDASFDDDIMFISAVDFGHFDMVAWLLTKGATFRCAPKTTDVRQFTALAIRD